MEQRVGGFVCKDSNGRTVKVYIYQDMIDTTTMGDTHRKFTAGLKRLELEHGGGPVNFIDDNTLEIVATGEKLTIEK
jgi:hypothetical protein